MKYKTHISIGIAALAALGVTTHSPHAWAQTAESTGAAATKHLYVELHEAKVRAKPVQWAPGVADVVYGDKIDILGEEGAWYRVSAGGKEGFLHKTAVTKQTIVLKARSEDVQIEADETSIVLAGKGFNKDIENNYSGSGSAPLNYAAVDCLEGNDKCVGTHHKPITQDQFAKFIEEGRLGGDLVR